MRERERREVGERLMQRKILKLNKKRNVETYTQSYEHNAHTKRERERKKRERETHTGTQATREIID